MIARFDTSLSLVANRVAEGQSLGAGAAGIGRRAAIIERQGRGAGHVHRRTEVERQGHYVAGKFGAGRRVGGDIENRGRIVFKAVRGDHGRR